ncbi:MAG: VWA domain-containing protein [Candidatus Eremiobacteraeota bacterium]|nr:VWA domain-containing protein [Candidatus Eremiobacteraeota bacterium]
MLVGQAPSSPVEKVLVPRSEPNPSYPRYQSRQANPVSFAVPEAQAAAPEPGRDFASVNIDQFLGLNSSTSCAVVLLVDVSGSVFQQGVEVAVDAAAKIYARQSSSDRVWVVAFGSQPEVVVNGHGGVLSREQLGRALTNSRPAKSGTFLAPAIQLATSTLGHSTQARRVVVVSDGILGDAEMAIWQAAHAWSEREISFSTVHIGNDWSGAAILQEIAGQTGGRFVSAR